MVSGAALAGIVALSGAPDAPPDAPADARRLAPAAPVAAIPAADGPRLVMIDPGHGGGNLGAPSVRHGLREKHLTLALARELRAALARRGVAVQLTRDRDEYLTLRERMVRATRAGADVFVSLHLNATEDHAQRGFETWILTPEALDRDGRALRGDDGTARRDPALGPLLDDLERGAALPEAAALARAIQSRLATVRGREHDRGVRQGSQDVLLGATMPAVLVELGFVDHPIEGAELLDAPTRTRLVEALADAIAES